jgi:hypothetical protein
MRRCIFILVGLMAVGFSFEAGGFPTEPSRSWVYPYLYELRIRQGGGPIFISTGPYERCDIARWLDDLLETDLAGDERSAWLQRMLEQEFRAEVALLDANGHSWTGDTIFQSCVRTDRRLQAEGFIRFCLNSGHLAMWTSLRSTLNAPGLHKIETRTWRRRGRASFDNGGLGFRKGGLSIFFGRDEMSWGASRDRGLLLRGSGPNLDMLRLAYRTERVLLTSFHAQLRRGRDDVWDETVRRFVAGHRVEILAGRHITFSLSEVVIYGGEGRTLEPVYLNPLTVFYAEQWNSEQNDNIFIEGDFSVLFPKRAEIRGEIVIDDFQYDFVNEPHELGAGINVVALGPIRPDVSLIGGSYYHVRNQTYGHFIKWNSLIHEGKVMGYPDGPDGDRLMVWSSVAVPVNVLWKIDYALRRKGEGRATDPQDPEGHKVAFPSGTVETAHTFGLDVTWRPAYRWLIGGRLEWSRRENSDNIEGKTDEGLSFAINASFNLKFASNLNG